MVETTTRLWYELPAVLRLAEHTRRATAADRRRFGAPNVPSLLFTHDWRHLLTSTAVPVPLREHTLRPRHVDGWTVPPHAPTSYHHLPLTRPATLPGRRTGTGTPICTRPRTPVGCCGGTPAPSGVERPAMPSAMRTPHAIRASHVRLCRVRVSDISLYISAGEADAVVRS